MLIGPTDSPKWALHPSARQLFDDGSPSDHRCPAQDTAERGAGYAPRHHLAPVEQMPTSHPGSKCPSSPNSRSASEFGRSDTDKTPTTAAFHRVAFYTVAKLQTPPPSTVRLKHFHLYVPISATTQNRTERITGIR